MVLEFWILNLQVYPLLMELGLQAGSVKRGHMQVSTLHARAQKMHHIVPLLFVSNLSSVVSASSILPPSKLVVPRGPASLPKCFEFYCKNNVSYMSP
mmetsp:Transcript_1776/g.4491  ORF Transcript_1776/g.4491 Transcript_1776/m.4491 type:complete len:97 (-) Transcript_1776:824-1114(-)